MLDSIALIFTSVILHHLSTYKNIYLYKLSVNCPVDVSSKVFLYDDGTMVEMPEIENISHNPC